MITIIKAIDWDGQPNPFVTLLSVEHDAEVDPVQAIKDALDELIATEDFDLWLSDVGLYEQDFVWWAYMDDIPKKYLKKHGIKSIKAPNTVEVDDTYGIMSIEPEEEV